jgi:hypothetical protein
MHLIGKSLAHALTITSFVFAMMVLVDYFNVLTRGKLGHIVRGRGFRQHLVTSGLGATPGCLGSFMNVSFYLRGIISFGALAGGMIATSGDEAFVMLALFPGKALLLMATLFLVGTLSSLLIDKAVKVLKIQTSEGCEHTDIHEVDELHKLSLKETLRNLRHLSMIRFLLIVLLAIFLFAFASGLIGPEAWDWKRITFIAILSVTLLIVSVVPEHYLEVHIWEHITKKHLWRIMAWSFGALLVVHAGLETTNLEAFVQGHLLWVLLIALLFGLIPESGPHLIFVIMFAKGLIPFSILLASSIVQDGHGILPLLSHSIKDSILIKVFSLIIGLVVGLILYFAGL